MLPCSLSLRDIQARVDDLPTKGRESEGGGTKIETDTEKRGLLEMSPACLFLLPGASLVPHTGV